jgi:hypothetical protein
MTDPKLRDDLLSKLGVTRQRLSQRVSKRKGELPMSTELAVYTIAHQEGMDISRYLSPEVTAEVRGLVAQLRPNVATSAGVAETTRRRRGGTPRPTLVTIAGVKVDQLPGMSATRAREAKVMAEKVYPMLYVFENSAREVITTILQRAFGDDWWNQTVPKRQRERAASHKADEAKDPWHGKRGAAPIDYLLLSDLPDIITTAKAWPHFEPLFGRRSWFSELIADLNVSRRVVSHMNPLETDDVKNVEAAFRKWAKLLTAKKNLVTRT